jgi:hypothetical protein
MGLREADPQALRRPDDHLPLGGRSSGHRRGRSARPNRRQAWLEGPFWDAIGGVSENFGALGYAIGALFIVSWLISFLIYRAKGRTGLVRKAEAGAATVMEAR